MARRFRNANDGNFLGRIYKLGSSQGGGLATARVWRVAVDLMPAQRASEGRRKSLRRKARTLAGASGWYPNRRPRRAAGTVNLRSGTLGRSLHIGVDSGARSAGEDLIRPLQTRRGTVKSMATGRIIRAGIQARHPPPTTHHSRDRDPADSEGGDAPAGGRLGQTVNGRRMRADRRSGRGCFGRAARGRIVRRVGGAEQEMSDERRARFRRKLAGRVGSLAVPVGPVRRRLRPTAPNGPDRSGDCCRLEGKESTPISRSGADRSPFEPDRRQTGGELIRVAGPTRPGATPADGRVGSGHRNVDAGRRRNGLDGPERSRDRAPPPCRAPFSRLPSTRVCGGWSFVVCLPHGTTISHRAPPGPNPGSCKGVGREFAPADTLARSGRFTARHDRAAALGAVSGSFRGPCRPGRARQGLLYAIS